MLGISKQEIEQKIRGGLVMPQDANLRSLIDRLSRGVVGAMEANNQAIDRQIGEKIDKHVRNMLRYGL